MLATIVQFAGVHFFTKRGYGEEMHALSDSEEEEDEDLYQNYNNLQTVCKFFIHLFKYRCGLSFDLRSNEPEINVLQIFWKKSF